MPEENENLEQLFGCFLGEAQARRAAEDVRAGEAILEQYAAPLPDARVLEKIKAEVGRSLAAAGRRRLNWVRRSIAAAVIIAAACILLFITGDQPTSAFADPGPEWWSDARVRSIRAEIDAVLDTMISIDAEGYGFDEEAGEFAELELEELEMVAMNEDFWKG